MTTPAPDQQPTRATVPNQSDGSKNSHHESATSATVPSRSNHPAVSATQPTIPLHNPSGDSATAATHLNVKATIVAPPAASGSHNGEVWGDFEIGKLLGRGGMGAVYQGRQISLDRPVAVKLLSEHLTHSDDFRKRFLLEARAAARINSPHVVQVYFAGSHLTAQKGETHFFAMEYVEGTDLSRKLKDGYRPTPDECLGLVLQATRSLVALADHNIVHRDIKPANFMLTNRGQLKLMDFGLVKFASEAHGLTQTGTVMGTVNYFSPEQGRGEVCDQRTDIYALGVMFYEMLTARLPFTGGDATSVIYQHIHTEPKPPRIHNPAVTEPYQSIVLKCLAKDPDDRYKTAMELLADLERIQRGEQPLAVLATKKAARIATATSPSPQRLTVAAAVVVAAVILGLAIFLRPVTPVSITTISDTHVKDAVSTPVVPVVAVNNAPVSASALPQPIAVIATPIITAVPTAKPAVTVVETKPEIIVQAAAVEKTPPTAPIPAPELTPEKPVVIAPVIVPVPIPPVAPPKPPEPIPVPTPAPIITKVTPPPAPVTKPALPPLPVTKPAVPIGFSAPVQTTVAVQIPAKDAILTGTTFLWWLTGPPGHTGRLAARSTTIPTNHWTAPALPGNVTLHVAAVGNPRVVDIPLKAIAAPLSATTTLELFARASFTDERRTQHLQRDTDGSWWSVDVQEAAINRMSDSWLLSSRAVLNPKPPRPLALALQAKQVAVLDSDQPALLIYNRDGTAHRTITGLQRPSDMINGPGQQYYVADQKAGGILVFNNDGVRTGLWARNSTGVTGFVQLTKLASNGTLVYALDVGAKNITVFDQGQVVATWALEAQDRPVAITERGGFVYVLLYDGMVRVLDAKGQMAHVIPSATIKFPEEELGPAGGIAVDVTGEIYITFPDREMMVRHAGGGNMALRHARTWTWRAYAADATGNLFVIDSDHRRVVVLDAEGWRSRTVGAPVGKGGTLDTPIMLAAHPNGSALAVYDEDTLKITRYDLTNDTHLVFGSKGSANGQFDTPSAIAMDAQGRTFVLDTALHRVAAFAADGKFIMNIGRYERGDAPDLLRVPRMMCVSPDGTQIFVYEEESQMIKHYSVDYATNQVRHMRNLGGPGMLPGQFARVTGMGCDFRGRLYVLDYKRADLQIFDSTNITSNTPVTVINATDFNIRRMLYLALNPDGLPFIVGSDQMTGLRWKP